MLPPLIATLALFQAVEWPSTGDWTVLKSTDRCMAIQEYGGAGATNLMVSIEADGSTFVVVNNYNWTTVENQNYPEISATLDRYVYSGAPAVGNSNGIRRGLIFSPADDFLDDFARSRSLQIHNGDTLVDSLNLDGSAVAVSSLRQCFEALRREKQSSEEERQRLSHIPINPFATAPAQTSSEDSGLWSQAPIVTQRDYPQRALDRNIGGSATIECNISRSARPEACRVISEEPAGMGFGSAAIRIVSLARLSAATADSATPNQKFTYTVDFPID